MSNFIRGRHAPSLPAFLLPDSTEGPYRGPASTVRTVTLGSPPAPLLKGSTVTRPKEAQTWIGRWVAALCCERPFLPALGAQTGVSSSRGTRPGRSRKRVYGPRAWPGTTAQLEAKGADLPGRGQGPRETNGSKMGEAGRGGGQCVCVCVCVSTHDKEGLKIRGWEEWRCESKEQKWTKREGM